MHLGVGQDVLQNVFRRPARRPVPDFAGAGSVENYPGNVELADVQDRFDQVVAEAVAAPLR